MSEATATEGKKRLRRVSTAKQTQAVSDAGEAAKRNQKRVRALVIPLRPKAIDAGAATLDGDSKIDQDPWEDLQRKGRVIEPPFDMWGLTTVQEQSAELGPDIAAMQTNIVGFGWKLKPLKGVDEDAEAVVTEREDFEEFLKYGAWDESSLTMVRRHCRWDLESTGNSFLEWILNSRGKIIGYNHVPSFQMRLSVLDKEPTTYTQIRVVGRGQKRRLKRVKRRKRFRRYIQAWTAGGGSLWQWTWFKELGDPRAISKQTGEVLEGADAKDSKKLANAMTHNRIYSPRTPYGVPRWIGALLTVMGLRAGEEINYTTFLNNNIPSLALLVSNGQVTSGTVKRIEEFVSTHIQGQENYSKILIIEADPDDDDGIGGGQVKLDLKPLTSEQHTDQLFQNYDMNGSKKIRRNFRLPPIVTGDSDDYTRSTADTSRRLAEEQVFEPERREEDWEWNKALNRMGMLWHEFTTNSPNVTNDEDLIKIMGAAERSGGMTPRRATDILEDLMGREVAPMSKNIDPDVPWSKQMAEAVKNQAQPSEVGQQVTALKTLRDEFVMKDRIDGLPAVRLSAVHAMTVARGIETTLELTEKAEGGAFAVVDDRDVVAVVELGNPEEISKGVFIYAVTRRVELSPTPYIPGDGEIFLDAIDVP